MQLVELGYGNCIDAVYGASAGSLISAYFLSGQTHLAADILLNWLPTRTFVNKRQLFTTALESINPTWRNRKDSFSRTKNQAIIHLDDLLDELLSSGSFDWSEFWKRNRLQPLTIIATDILTLKPVKLSSVNGFLTDSNNVKQCLVSFFVIDHVSQHASMNIPALAGAITTLHNPAASNSVETSPVKTKSDETIIGAKGSTWNRWSPFSWSMWKRMTALWPLSVKSPAPLSFGTSHKSDSLLLSDVFLSEPIPFQSAIQDGCDHVLVACSQPDGKQILGAPVRFYERFIARRYFDGQDLKHASRLLYNQDHHRIYAESVLQLNKASRGDLLSSASVLPVAIKSGNKSLSPLFLSRSQMLDGLRKGAMRMVEVLEGNRLSNGEIIAVTDKLFPKQ